jgi:hypothetical protein
MDNHGLPGFDKRGKDRVEVSQRAIGNFDAILAIEMIQIEILRGFRAYRAFVFHFNHSRFFVWYFGITIKPEFDSVPGIFPV